VSKAKAERRQRCLSLTQEVSNLLCIDCPCCLQLLHLLACGAQLLKLFLGQSLILVRQLLLLGSQGVFLEGDAELVVEEVSTHLPHTLMLYLHGNLTSAKVSNAGHELTALAFKHANDLFFLLL
jgi:hypothetical protein